MTFEIRREDSSLLDVYSTVPISFLVDSMYRLVLDPTDILAFQLAEERVDEPYIKDYDEQPGNRPENELKKLDIKNWVFYSAYRESSLVGGLILAHKSEKTRMLEGRDDITCIWDIRIHPKLRRMGVGTALFQAAIDETMRLGCKFMKIETQNTNVRACNFYRKQGSRLGAINRYAYREYPDEMQLVWYYFID